jgi:adenosylcobinamide-phosphate guanylyltransferase
MSFVALIMAGGKGTRFHGKTEKPMALFMGTPLIKRVIDATKESKKITETYVAVTLFTPKTTQEVKNASVKIIETDGQGYHEDLKQAIKTANLFCPVLIISADLPLLTGEFIDNIIEKYVQSGKPALTVLVPQEAFLEYGLSAVSVFEFKGKMYAVSGINILDGHQILEEQEQEVVFSSSPEAVFTVNSREDLDAAKKYVGISLKGKLKKGS